MNSAKERGVKGQVRVDLCVKGKRWREVGGSKLGGWWRGRGAGWREVCGGRGKVGTERGEVGTERGEMGTERGEGKWVECRGDG